MTKKEKWITWNKTPLSEEYNLTNFLYYFDKDKGLIIVFERKDGSTIHVTFRCIVEHFCFTDEGSKNVLFGYLSKNYPDNFLRNHNHFEVFNSNLIKRLVAEEGETFWDPEKMKHYVFMNNEGVFEVIAHCEPTITLVKE